MFAIIDLDDQRIAFGQVETERTRRLAVLEMFEASDLATIYRDSQRRIGQRAGGVVDGDQAAEPGEASVELPFTATGRVQPETAIVRPPADSERQAVTGGVAAQNKRRTKLGAVFVGDRIECTQPCAAVGERFHDANSGRGQTEMPAVEHIRVDCVVLP